MDVIPDRLGFEGRFASVGALSLRLAALAAVGAGLAVSAGPATASGPPPGRAYELVSPVDDIGGSPAGVAIDSRPLPGLAPAVGDDRVVYGAVSPIGETESGATNPFIFGRRTATGWKAISGMRTTDGGETALGFNQSDTNKTWINDEGTGLVFMVSNALGLPQPDPNGQVFQSVYRVGEVGLPQWLSGPAPGATLNTVSIPQEVVASRDLQTVAFQSSQPLTPDGPPDGQVGVYALRDGELQLASVLPNGDLPTGHASFANPATTNATNQSDPPALTLRNLLTRDGRYLVFKVGLPDGTAELYVRDLEEGTTRALAPSSGPAVLFGSFQGTDNVYPWIPGGDASTNPVTMPLGFVTVASGASVAFFRSGANLAPGASGSDYDKLYQADLATGELTYRAEIDGPPVELSADGSKVLFLRPTGESRVDPWELRFWDADAPDESVLLGSISGLFNAGSNGMVRSLRSSTDGRTWVFTAADSLDPDRLNVAPATQQVYRWRVGDAHPVCLSCEPVDGQARFTGAALSQAEAQSTQTLRKPNGETVSVRKYAVAQRSRAISDDGRLVAFDSPDRLVAEDTNGVRDVYLWDADAAPEDRLRMLTGGQGSAPSYYIDMSPDGRNVFFSTQDGLVAADKDLAYDVYVARRGGGFPGSPESCVAETCRPPAAPAPLLGSPGSLSLTGDGNAAQDPAQASVVVPKLKAVIGTAARLKVRVLGAGRISVAGASVRRTNKSATKAGTYSVKIALSKKAKKKLKRKKRLEVRVRIAFEAKGGQSAAKTISVTFKQPKAKRTAVRKGR